MSLAPVLVLLHAAWTSPLLLPFGFALFSTALSSMDSAGVDGGAFVVPIVPHRDRGGRVACRQPSSPTTCGEGGAFDPRHRRRSGPGKRSSSIPSSFAARRGSGGDGDGGGGGGATNRRRRGEGLTGFDDDGHHRRGMPPPTARSVAIDALMEGGGGGGKRGKKHGATQTQQQPFAVRRLEADPCYVELKDRRDRSFARLLVATVERRMGQIDAVLGRVASVYPPKRGKHASRVQACLRVGAAQLLFLDTPHHAAIKETVDVLKIPSSSHGPGGGGGPKVPEPMVKFVNAVLRSISRTGAEESLRGTSATDNVSPWLVRELEGTYGTDVARAVIEEMSKGEPPPLDISAVCNLRLSGDERIVALEGLRRDLSGDGDDGAAVVLPHGTIRLGRGGSALGAMHDLPRFDEWWVQDASAAVPALALRNAVLSAHGGGDDDASSSPSSLSRMHVVDMCAAPGGKTAQLLSAGFGRVTAVESNARRSRRLEENMRRLHFLPSSSQGPAGHRGGGSNLSIVVSDGQAWLPSSKNGGDAGGDGYFGGVVDAVLLDAPCSATGTGRRRPDVLRREECSLEGLVRNQEELLAHCTDNVLRPGGILVYATCSILRREGEDQVERVLRRSVDRGAATLETLPFVPGEIPGFDDAIDERGWLRVLPGMTLEGDMKTCDGFFVAKLIRVA